MDANARWPGFAGSRLPLALITAEGRFLDVNVAFCGLLGRSREWLLGRLALDVTHPEDVPLSRERANEMHVRPEGVVCFEKRYLHADGVPVWAVCMGVRVEDARGDPSYLLGVVDVSTRRVADATGEAEARFRAVFDFAPVGMALFPRGLAPDARLLLVNRALVAAGGWSAEELVRVSLTDLIHPDDGEAVLHAARRVVDGAVTTAGGEWRLRRRDGSTLWAQIQLGVVRGPDGAPLYGIAQVADITARTHAAHQLERRVAQQAAVAELGERGLEGLDADALVHKAVELLHANLAADRAMFLEVGQNGTQLLSRAGVGYPPEAVGRVCSVDRGSPASSAVRTGEPIVIDDWTLRPAYAAPPLTGDAPTGSTMVTPVRGRGRPIGAIVVHADHPRAFTAEDLHFLQSLANVLSDAIERERVEAETRHEALHDRVTGLPNRALLLDRLRLALSARGRRRRRVAVLFLDLDDFKLVNDTLGHAAGDDVLRQVAPRLRDAVRPSDTVARFGGDEFVLLCEQVSEHEAVAIAERVLQAFAAPFVVGGEDHFLSTSVGIALWRRPADTPESLLRDADAAMYRAKERGRGRFEVFDEDLRHRALTRLRVESELRRALDHDELVLHYQPAVDMRTRTTVAFEALVRWRHPERGLVTPGEFIGVAESSGLIVPMTEWVLRRGLAQLAQWRTDPRHERLALGVNVSARDVARREFVDVVVAALADARVPPDRLSLEITESALMEASDAPVETLRDLDDLGVLVTLDDFGTGYSSLSYLERFPIDALKIDRGFVAPLAAGAVDGPILRAIIGLGGALDLHVVAEGVETRAQEERLLDLGCIYAQGYRYAPPLDPVACADPLAPPVAT